MWHLISLLLLLTIILPCTGQDSLTLDQKSCLYEAAFYDWYAPKFAAIPSGLGVLLESAPWVTNKTPYQKTDLQQQLQFIQQTIGVRVVFYPSVGRSLLVEIHLPDSVHLDPELLQWYLEDYQLQDQKGQVIKLGYQLDQLSADLTTIISTDTFENAPKISARAYVSIFNITNITGFEYPLTGYLTISLSYSSTYDTLLFSKQDVGSSKVFQNNTIKLLGLEQNVACYQIKPVDPLLSYDTFFYTLESPRVGQVHLHSVSHQMCKHTIPFLIGLNHQQQPMQLTFEQRFKYDLLGTAIPIPSTIYTIFKENPALSKADFSTLAHSFMGTSLQQKGGVELDARLQKFYFPVDKLLFYAPAISPRYRFRVDL